MPNFGHKKHNSKGRILNDKVLEKWRADPIAFYEKCRWPDALQAIWDGLPVEALIPFLKSDQVETHAAAMHVVGELGERARPLLKYAKPYLKSHDQWTRCNAMDCILVCGSSEEFALVLEMLLHTDPGTQYHARLRAINAGANTLKAARGWFDPPKRKRATRHIEGLDFLLSDPSLAAIEAFAEKHDPLLRAYAEIARGRKEDIKI